MIKLESTFKDLVSKYRRFSAPLRELYHIDGDSTVAKFDMRNLRPKKGTKLFEYEKPNSKHTFTIRIGALLRKISSHKDHTIEKATSLIKVLHLHDSLKLVISNNFKYAYNRSNYPKSYRYARGCNLYSCMTYPNAKAGLRFYELNGNTEVATLVKGKKVYARTVVWYNVEDSKGRINSCSDVIYGADAGIRIMMKARLRKNNIINGHAVMDKMTVDNTARELLPLYPYLDTFEYFSRDLTSMCTEPDDTHFLILPNSYAHRYTPGVVGIGEYKALCPKCGAVDKVNNLIIRERNPIGCTNCLIYNNTTKSYDNVDITNTYNNLNTFFNNLGKTIEKHETYI